MSCIVYIQDHLGWKIGVGVLVMLMLATVLSFFLASPFYIKLKSKANFLTSFAQVIVATYKNRNASVSSEGTSMTYHHKKGSVLLVPSDKLRYHSSTFSCQLKKSYYFLKIMALDQLFNSFVVFDSVNLLTI